MTVANSVRLFANSRISVVRHGNGATARANRNAARKFSDNAALLTSGRLNSYLADIDRQAEEMFSRLVNQIAKAEGVTEVLKAADPMEWVGRMNNIRNRAIEIVNAEIIHT